MKAEILTLLENTVRTRGLIAEHGLSFLIQADQRTVLFDTGQGHALIPNADEMDVDLKGVERIVLSHGHSDHTGGLKQVLERIGPREVFAHPDALAPKYSIRSGNTQYIGLPESREALEQAGADFHLHEGPVEIVPGITATGRVPRVTDFEKVRTHFQTGSEEDLGQDMIWDDQSLIVETERGPVVVLGCAHSGIVNTLLYAAELSGRKRFSAAIGGTHLVDADEICMRKTADALGQFDIERIAPCHCTGFLGQVALLEAFRERFVLNSVGDRFEFGQ